MKHIVQKTKEQVVTTELLSVALEDMGNEEADTMKDSKDSVDVE